MRVIDDLVDGSMALTLDLQWTKSAIEQIDDAFLIGFRLNVSF